MKIKVSSNKSGIDEVYDLRDLLADQSIRANDDARRGLQHIRPGETVTVEADTGVTWSFTAYPESKAGKRQYDEYDSL